MHDACGPSVLCQAAAHGKAIGTVTELTSNSPNGRIWEQRSWKLEGERVGN